MASPVAALATCGQSSTPKSNFNRPSANFHPNIWGDHFVAFASDNSEIDDDMKQWARTLKKELRRMLVSLINNLLEKLNLIDSIQRLGVSYHFEKEIDEVLQQIHNTSISNGSISHDGDLHSHALLFRLLRQHGYHISSDTFEEFKDGEGNFSEKLTSDVRGMLSLYEASEMRVHGEDILDQAFDFTYSQLKLLTSQLNPALAAQVNHGLRHPLRKVIPRLEARIYMSLYQQDPSYNGNLLTFAKLDFNVLQKLHQKEVGSISLWWKDLNFSTKLSFARNRIVECYLWIIGVYFEPKYYFARRITTKVIAMASIIDDIYDAYGTIDELELFTNAIERWDTSSMNDLPDYMKFCYRTLLDIYDEIEYEVTQKGRTYCVKYAKDEMKQLAQAYFTEARWLSRNYIPTLEEYMKNATISSGYSMVTATSFVGMGDNATEEIFKWLSESPKVIESLSLLARIMDDIVSNEFEQNRGHVASIIECYMKKHEASREEAIDELQKLVIKAWKDINKGCLQPTQVPMPFLERIVNLARVMNVFYKDEDCYTNPGGAMKDYVTILFVDPIPI